MEDLKAADAGEKTIDERMEAFRFFELSGKDEKGDRFLQPWLYCHVFAAGSKGRGERKRAGKELKRFFAQKDLVAILKDAAEESDALMEMHLFDSADRYLTICRDDDGFGRKLFGLVRMKSQEKEEKIIADVYRSMIPLLAQLPDLSESRAMIRSLDRACRNLYPQRLADMEAASGVRENDSLRILLDPFDHTTQENDESIHGR